MTEIKYPRNQMVRALMRGLGRLVIRLLTRTRIEGLENYPKEGRLLVVANHSGIMETVLMTCFGPRHILKKTFFTLILPNGCRNCWRKNLLVRSAFPSTT